jgi:hypothetical protein
MAYRSIIAAGVVLFLPLLSTGLASPRPGKRNLAKQSRGFQKPSPPDQTEAPSAAASIATKVASFNLGGGHVVRLFVPAFDALGAASGSDGEVAAKFRDQFYGAGDVVWPSSLALARLVANCPSFVKGRRVVELGCGLGLVSAAALTAGPRTLCLSDLNGAVLALALRSCTELQDPTTAGGSGATAGAAAGATLGACAVEAFEGLDWTKPSTWPRGGSYGSGPGGGDVQGIADAELVSGGGERIAGVGAVGDGGLATGGSGLVSAGELVPGGGGGGGFEVVLASDVLYSEAAVASVAELVAHLLRPAADPASPPARHNPTAQASAQGGSSGAAEEFKEGEEEEEEEEVVRRALIVDPANRLHRSAFVAAAHSVGLAAVPVPFPGHPDLVLINITPMEAMPTV